MCIRDRVTPGLSNTIASLLWHNLLTKVDFPTLGLPIIAIEGRVNYSSEKFEI